MHRSIQARSCTAPPTIRHTCQRSDDSDRRTALPTALRAWLRFALTRRGADSPWIAPVVATVEDQLPEFTAAFDDESSRGPTKHLVADLTARGIDLTDHDAVERGVRAVNAADLARTLLDGTARHGRTDS